MIELVNVTKIFDKRPILTDFSMEVDEGEFVSIVGPSGSGKTTILNMIGLLSKSDSGNVTIMDYTNPTKKQTLELRRHIFGYVFQNYVLMDNETVKQNLLLSKKYNKDFNDGLVADVLQQVGLNTDFLTKKIYQLSGGEQQRIAIARAMLKPSKIILADEPTGNLDEGNKEGIIELFHHLKEIGKTVICVTHDQEVANQSDRVITVKKLVSKYI